MGVFLDHFERIAAHVHGQEELKHVRLRERERVSEREREQSPISKVLSPEEYDNLY